MRLLLLLAIIVMMAVIQMPALAVWGINADVPQPPAPKVAAAPSDQPAWTDQLQGHSAMPQPVVESASDAAYVEVVKPEVQDHVFIKSDKDMRLLNTTSFNYKTSANQMIPEPGGFAALSVGLVGLLGLVGRARKKY